MGQLIKQFGKIKVTTPIPHLLTLQIDSYSKFLQEGVSAENRRKDVGLEGVFRTVFPIEDFNKTASLEFDSYEIQEPKYDQAECISKGLTYEAPVRIKVRLAVYDVDEAGGQRQIRDIKEQDIYFGTLPLMTEKGTFIVNGTERVIVNQLQRSPGIIFEHDGGKTHASRKVLYSCRVIPMRGSWLDFDFDHKDILYVRIDRRRKMPATILFKAMGMDKKRILDEFYPVEKRETYYLEAPEDLKADGKAFPADALFMAVYPGDPYRKDTAYADILDREGKPISRAGKNITKRQWRLIQESGLSAIEVAPNYCDGMFFGEDISDPNTGEIIAEMGDDVTVEILQMMRDAGVKKFTVLHTKGPDVSSSMRDTLMMDKTADQEKAQEEIYRRLRPSSPPTPEIATSFFDNIFRNIEYYDLSPVGRYKLNQRLGFQPDQESIPDGKGGLAPCRTLTDNDILTAIKILCHLKDTHGAPDDIDHLGNRRVRLVGELVENQYRIGLVRMERAIKERMSLQEISTLMPHDLINPKPVAAVLKEFFGTSQLSQFMDQTNALSEVTHKRRLSALGPGGLTRERAGFEVRDVHTSHYGRICPIETPEGPNIGLISSLGLYAHIDEFGFIETPYRRVVDGRVTDEVVHMTADEEEQYVIAQANCLLDKDGHFLTDRVIARHKTEFVEVPSSTVQFMDVSPLQVISIAAGLIPFLEHDDANRALMGANMMRQAVPLLRPDRPYVATGLELRAAEDSCVTVLAEADGIVAYVDALKVAVSNDGKFPKGKAARTKNGTRVYELQKFRRTNAGTCFNQKPIVRKGQKVKAGDVLADGPATKEGELSLGKNLTVAYMPWNGFNFEDAILLSERCVRDDVFTSVHIQEFEASARDTKLGPEEITRDIPNVGEDALKNLGADGVIRVGAEIRPGDILVGKVTPKSEAELAPEEKLLRVIFGEKAADVRDSSLTVPSGTYGIVMDVKVTSQQDAKHGLVRQPAPATRNPDDEPVDLVEDDHLPEVEMDQPDENAGEMKNALVGEDELDAEADRRRQREELEGKLTTALSNILLGEKIPLDVIDTETGDVIIPQNRKITKTLLSKLAKAHAHIQIDPSPVQQKIQAIIDDYADKFAAVAEGPDEVAASVEEESGEDKTQIVKNVRVFVAEKKNLSVGDKLAGRHGNKGVVSRILKDCDMPYLPDGTPVDIVLNPLGVPSRMNLGQLFEAYLGAACKELGLYAATPVFDGVSEKEIDELLGRARQKQIDDGKVPYINVDGKSVVYDGRTGKPFDQRVVIGQTYFLKLHHLVTDKIHARATGPYSLVTQQPLGGKAQYGGQRMGEMEVWALEAYGVAYALQELLTVKSDDVAGRTRIYESIVKGTNSLEAGLPESFSVLMHELRGLCLDMKLLGDENDAQPPSRL